MKTPALFKLDRRQFLKGGAATTGGLVLGFRLGDSAAQFGAPAAIAPDAFIHIGTDDVVTLTVHKPEIGQGTETSIAQLLAEELDCDWSRVQTRFAPVNPVYGGPLQGTFGSMAIRTSYEPMRRTGAAARQMLVQAAATQWGVDAARLRTENGFVLHPDGNERLSYGSLAELAAALPVPEEITLKQPSEFRYIGKSVKRLDSAAKSTGRTQFGIDMQMDGMVYAVVARCPVPGGKAVSFDASRALAVPGVKDVIQIAPGIAVLAENTWAAIEGRRQLDIQWDEGANAGVDSAGISRRFDELLARDGAVARESGEGRAALAQAARTIEAVYDAPYLAHACMEPFSALAVVTADACEVWTGTQIPGLAHAAAVEVSGLSPEQVKIHTLYMGGGFGARGGGSWVSEVVEIAKLSGVPVKLLWTREDDLQHDRYRPASRVRLAAGLDAQGRPLAWTGRVTCSSFAGLRNGVDREAVAGLADLDYAFPHVFFDYHEPGIGIPTNFWRSVGHSQNTFFAESFLDELAIAAGQDPVEYRRALLDSEPRLRNVLDLAAEKAGWGSPLPPGRARGVAIAHCFGSYNAQVAEVSIEQGRLKVHKVVSAVDCGQVVNPNGVVQQMQSAIVYGLSAALRGAITFERGRAQQVNFHQYEPLRMKEMPLVDVHIVESGEAPGGIGEVGTPAIAPAVTNAVFALTGKRIRALPISLTNLGDLA